MAFDITRFLARFVEESRDHLTQLGTGLDTLESTPDDTEAVHALFRSAHTLKGSSRMLRLTPITEAAHALEDVLGAIREGTLPYNADLGRLLRRAIDALATQIDAVAEGGAAPAPDPALTAALAATLRADGGASAAPAAPRLATPIPPAATASLAPPTATAPADGAPAAPAPTARAEGGSSTASSHVPPSPASSSTSSSASPTEGLPSGGETPGGGPRFKATETVRVALPRLDDLIKLMGEVVSGHARLHQRLADLRLIERQANRTQDDETAGADKALIRRLARDLREDVFVQDLLMRELHAKALGMRMLPLATVFDPAARLVRELGLSLGKTVTAQTSGMDIELDRHLLDCLSDPLVHLLRNAVDHGVETPEVRMAAGKPAHGTVRLAARQEGGVVVIELSDDGAGLAFDAIRSRAVRKGLLTAEQAAALGEADLADLIFLPGFSTSRLITEVSGRGVGMDVVKRVVVDTLQGSLSVDSRPGHGTTFRLRLPLSLAVMRILLVAADTQTFGLTAQSVVQILRVPRDRVLQVAERDVVVVHNEFIPLVSLARLLDLPPGPGEPAPSPSAGSGAPLLVVVVRGGQDRLALHVDSLIDESDMVLKPLPDPLRALPLVSGMVMTGQDVLVSVLHAPALLEAARRRRATLAGRAGAEAGASATPPEGLHILVVDDSLNTREIEKDVLEAHGYHVTLAEDGRDGLMKALAGTFDAVLTDVEMPVLDGFSLTAALRREERYRTIPIIIITSREKEEDKRRGIEVGADAYIVKGDFEQSSLVETLKSLLG